MPNTIKAFWENLSSGVKLILFSIAILTSFSSGQFIVNPQVKMNKILVEENRVITNGNSIVSQSNHLKIDKLSKSVEFLTQVAVATAKKSGVDTEEIRRKVEQEFRQLEAMSK